LLCALPGAAFPPLPAGPWPAAPGRSRRPSAPAAAAPAGPQRRRSPRTASRPGPRLLVPPPLLLLLLPLLLLLLLLLLLVLVRSCGPPPSPQKLPLLPAVHAAGPPAACENPSVAPFQPQGLHTCPVDSRGAHPSSFSVGRRDGNVCMVCWQPACQLNVWPELTVHSTSCWARSPGAPGGPTWSPMSSCCCDGILYCFAHCCSSFGSGAVCSSSSRSWSPCKGRARSERSECARWSNTFHKTR
jgi:hypothetical protein